MEDLTKLNKTELQQFLKIYEEQTVHIAQRMTQKEVIEDKALFKHFMRESKRLIDRKQQCKDLLEGNPISKPKPNWKTRLVYDLVTDKVLPFDEYCMSKQLFIKKGNAYHIDNKVEVKHKKQILKAIWYEGEKI
ncbi:MAG: hypothetical protein RSF67_02715 [Clostridia bacterium]